MRSSTLLPLSVAGVAVASAVLLLARPAHLPAARSDIVEPKEISSGPISVEHPDPVTLPNGAVAAGSGATRTGLAGVPLKFSHSTDGAVAAGTDWLTVVEGVGVLDASRRPALLSAIGDRTFAVTASARIAARAAALSLSNAGTPSSGYVMAAARPERGAYRVLSGGRDTARIEIWYPYQLAVLAGGQQPGPARWLRAQVALGWDARGNDWRLTEDFTFKDGPDAGEQLPSFVARAETLGSYGPGWHFYAEAPE